MAKKTQSKAEEKKIAYGKEQILNSKKYAEYKDLLNGVLENNRTYTTDEIDKLIADYMERRVD